jgi:hypothetical protein
MSIDYQEEYEKLKAAIIRHRSQKADDRCWLDDRELYYALGDGVEADFQVGDKLAMLENCARFIERRCGGGKWPSYAELEEKLRQAEAERDEAREGISAAHLTLDAFGVKRQDELGAGSFVVRIVEYPVCDRIKFLADEAGLGVLG